MLESYGEFYDLAALSFQINHLANSLTFSLITKISSVRAIFPDAPCTGVHIAPFCLGNVTFLGRNETAPPLSSTWESGGFMWAWSASLWWRSTCTSRPRSSHLPCTSGRAPGTSSTSGATRSSTEVRGQLQSHGVSSHSTTFGLCTSFISCTCSYLWSRLLWSFGKLRRPYSSTWLPHLQLRLAQGIFCSLRLF